MKNIITLFLLFFVTFTTFSQEVKETPKFNVMSVGEEGPTKKWKITLFSEKPNGGLKDIMTDDILEKLNLKKTYVSRESALEDLEKVNISDLEL